MAFWNRKPKIPAPLEVLPADERFRALERQHRALEEDLDDLHDRFKRFQGRAAKRSALDASDQAPVDSAPPAPTDDASARILSLRNRVKVRPGGVR